MENGDNTHLIGEETDRALAAIVRSIPDIIYRLDGQGHIVYISEAVRRYGYEPDELVGCNIFDLVHPDDRERATYKVNERRRGERGTRLLEVRLMTKDRETVDFELSTDAWPMFLINAEGIYDPDAPDGGGFLFTQGVARDISERERAEVDDQAALRDEIARREMAQKELQLIQFAVENAVDSVFWFGADGRILYANDETYKVLGYGRGELLGVHVSEISPELPGPDQWPARWETMREGPQVYSVEASWRAKDGTYVPVEVSASFFAYDGSEYVCSHVREISQRKREEARREARHRVREEIWGMRSVEDIENVIQVVRQNLVSLGVPVLGCSIHLVESEGEEPTVRSWRSQRGDDAWDSFQNTAAARQIVEMWRSGEPAYRRDLAQGGSEEFVRISGIFARDIRSVLDVPFSHGTLAVNYDEPNAYSDEDIELVLSLAEVLSEGFRRVEDLRGLEARTHDAEALAADLRKALEREAVMGRIRDQIIAMRSIRDLPSEDYWIEQLRALGVAAWGLSFQFPGEAEGCFSVYYLNEAGYSDDIPLSQAPWVAEAWESGRVVRVTREQILAVGMDDWAIKNILEVPLPGVGGSLGVNTEDDRPFDADDVHVIELVAGLVAEGLQRIRDFEALEDRDEQLRQAQKMEAVGELAAGIAHNFNNMLQGIVGNVHLAQLESGEELATYLQPAQDTAMRAAEMVRQLMLFARKGLQQARAPLDLHEQLHETVDIARQTFDRRIRIVEEAEEGLVVRADASQLQQVLMDLLLNARDALVGRDDPAIRVRWSRAAIGAIAKGEPSVRIEVEDNGTGMDEYTRARIFEPFFTTKPVDQGTGLGLSTVYGIVQQHGGRIDCQSVEGKGTVFTVFLPMEEVPEAGAGSEAETDAMGPQSAKILVVDDEEVVRESTRKMLGRAGYEVLVAEGAEAVGIARREEVGLVLLDMSMPDISGPEVLKALQREGIGARVVFFTGYLAEPDEYEGIDGVLQKPFSADELLSLVRRMLGG